MNKHKIFDNGENVAINLFYGHIQLMWQDVLCYTK